MANYYPPVSFHFKVFFNLGEGEADHRFQEVSGLNAEITTEEVKEGGLNEYAHKLPVKGKFPNLILKRGMVMNSDVIKWAQEAVESFTFSPTEVTIHLLNEEHQSIATWIADGAFVVKLSVSDFKAEENAFVVETLELAYRSFKRTQ